MESLKTRIRSRSIVACCIAALFFAATGLTINRLRSQGTQIPIGHSPTEGETSDEAKELSGAEKRGSREANQESAIKYGPMYQPFTDDGEANERLLTLAGISQDRTDEFEAILRGQWLTMSGILQKQSHYSAEKSAPDKGIKVYIFEGSKEVAETAKRALFSELSSSFGKGAAKMLVPYYTQPDYFAGFGEYDLELRSVVRRSASGRQSNLSVDFTVREPDSERILAKGSIGNRETYQIYFGTLLKSELLNSDWSDFKP